jgi:hypothetical protein
MLQAVAAAPEEGDVSAATSWMVMQDNQQHAHISAFHITKNAAAG